MCCVFQHHYDDERDKTVFHNITPDLQDQDQDHGVQDQDQNHSVQDQDQDFFWSPTGLVLRPTVSVSHHITGRLNLPRFLFPACGCIFIVAVCIPVYSSQVLRISICSW